MPRQIHYYISGDDIVRKIDIEGLGVKTSKLPIPSWVDREEPRVDIYDHAWLASREHPRVRASARPFRAIDLFCGCGGLTLGIQEAARGLGCGFVSVFASDNYKPVLEIYKRNFQPIVPFSDPIETFINGELGAPPSESEKAFMKMVGKIDIVVAGPPCQGNSNLNNHTRRDDPKNLLYLRAVRCIELLNPTSLIIENVPEVIHERHGVLQTADAYLRELGYSVSFGDLPMWKLGVPQHRRRMLLIGSRVIPGLDISTIIREGQLPERPLSWACGDLLNQYDATDIFNSASIHAPVNQARIHYLFEHDLHELPNSERPDCHRLKPHTYPGVYGRMWWDRPAPTITGGFACCGQGRFVHPLQERTLTPHEAARVQYFPDFFDFSGIPVTTLRKAIGNAVPPRAGYVVALPLLRGTLEHEVQSKSTHVGMESAADTSEE